MNKIKILEEVLEEIEKAMLTTQHPTWGESVTKEECFNDGIKEAHWVVQKMIKSESK